MLRQFPLPGEQEYRQGRRGGWRRVLRVPCPSVPAWPPATCSTLPAV